MLGEIHGRSVEIFFTADGARVNGLFISFLLEQPFVHRYQVHQRAIDHIIVRIVPTVGCDHAVGYHREVEALTARIHGVMGSECRIEFQFVGDIPRSASGKHRFLISDVDGLATVRPSAASISCTSARLVQCRPETTILPRRPREPT